ncbi:Tco5, signal transduction HAMP domain histidine kinase [Imleria badia]|nr:Tco5, signal transduction HAMP domain histidine kinase [Imleria badia]
MADLIGVPSPPHEFSQLPVPVALAGTQVSSRRRKTKTARFAGIKAHLMRFIKRVGADSPSDSSAVSDSCFESNQTRQQTDDGVEGDEVDEIVVDRDWTEDLRTSLDQPSERGPTRSSDSIAQIGTSLGRDTFALPDDSYFFSASLWSLRWKAWPAIVKFFYVRFLDDRTEERFHKEHWFIKKPLVLWSSVFLVVNWVLGACTLASPITIFDKIWLWGLTPALTFPLLVFVVLDFPRDRPLPYQILVGCATWCWGLYELLSMYLCGFYRPVRIFELGSKDFLGMFYYTSALQTIALFGLLTSRITALVGSLTFFIVASILILPYRQIWVRNLLNFILYHIFLLFVHYMHENSERRLFILREQLKIQFKETQKAQINERKEADSKRRLTSYVFHDEYYLVMTIRRNLYVLAVQNMEASGAVSKTQEIEFMALGGSLVMMSKVLNDMLDFNRMDSGRFEILSKPYAFHAVMRTLLIPLRMVTDARNLELVTYLDKTIDEVARCAAREAAGETPSIIGDEEDGVVLGDAIRLRQIVNNLASNACKFTPVGGRITCSTRLVFPAHLHPEPRHVPRPRAELDDGIEEVLVTPGDEVDGVDPTPTFSIRCVDDSTLQCKSPLKRIVVRIEVSDTGSGIPPHEITQGKLFTAFNQTEQGRQQGGKGTGLGLALVRQIVKLSGGRLGVRSKLGRGSTFWVELPLGVGVKVVNLPDPESGLSEKHPSVLEGPLSIELLQNRSPRPALVPNAMESLMDQGGMVELKLPNASDASEPHVLTRTIGELSSGTQLGPPLLSTGTSSLWGYDGSHSRVECSLTGSTPTIVDGISKRLVQKNPSPLPSSDSRSRYRLHAATCLSPVSAEPGASCLKSPVQGTPAPSLRRGPSAVFEPPMIVLVVDDDRLTRTIMSRTLSRLGCHVSTAENGEIALEMIVGRTFKRTQGLNEDSEHDDASCYDVVFLDNQMPIMSGLEVVAKLREMGRHDFVVGVTGNALIGDQREYFEAGVDHILTKPVFEPTLVHMLTIADERRRGEGW